MAGRAGHSDEEYEERQGLMGSGASSQWVKDASQEARLGFVRKVYGILTTQLILTMVVAAPFQNMPATWIRQNVWMLYGSMAVTFITICAMTCCQSLTRSYPYNYLFLFVFTAFEGVLIGFVSAGYTAGSVAMCVGITALIFAGLTVFAWKTDRDFTGMGPYLFGALLSLCVFGFVISIMAMCGIHFKLMMMLYDLIGVLVFVMYIIFDTQMIMGEYGGHKFQFSIDDYAFAALNLYLDIINLFLHLLRLLGERR